MSRRGQTKRPRGRPSRRKREPRFLNSQNLVRPRGVHTAQPPSPRPAAEVAPGRQHAEAPRLGAAPRRGQSRAAFAQIPPPEAALQPQVAQRARPTSATERDPRRPSRDAPRLTCDLAAHPSPRPASLPAPAELEALGRPRAVPLGAAPPRAPRGPQRAPSIRLSSPRRGLAGGSLRPRPGGDSSVSGPSANMAGWRRAGAGGGGAGRGGAARREEREGGGATGPRFLPQRHFVAARPANKGERQGCGGRRRAGAGGSAVGRPGQRAAARGRPM